MPVRSRSRCSSSESFERASTRSNAHSASSAFDSGRIAPPSPICAGGSSTSVRRGRRASPPKSPMRSKSAAIGGNASWRSGRSVSSVRRREARSRGVARRKRIFCAMRSRSNAPAKHLADRAAPRVLFQQRRDHVVARGDPLRVDERREDPARQHARTHRRRAQVQRCEQRRTRILPLRLRELQMLARRRVDREELAAPVELRLAQPAFAVRDAGAAHECAPAPRERDGPRAIRRSKSPESAARSRASTRPTAGVVSRTPASLERRRENGAQIRRDVRDDFGGSDARQLCEQLVVRVLAFDRGRRRVASRNVRVRERERLAGRGDRGEIVVLLAVEELFLDQRSRRHEAHDVATHEPVGLRELELFGERHHEALPHEAREILRQRMMRHARHRDALSRAGLFTGQRDLQRPARRSPHPRRTPRRSLQRGRAGSPRGVSISSRSTDRASASTSAPTLSPPQRLQIERGQVDARGRYRATPIREALGATHDRSRASPDVGAFDRNVEPRRLSAVRAAASASRA